MICSRLIYKLIMKAMYYSKFQNVFLSYKITILILSIGIYVCGLFIYNTCYLIWNSII